MYDNEIKVMARRWKNDGKSYTEIAALLKISKSSARNLCQYNNKNVCKKRGPKYILKKYEKLRIKRQISIFEKESQKCNSVKLKNSCTLSASKWTIQRHLRRIGFVYKKSTKQITLSKNHKEKRIEIVQQWVTKNHPWELTVFSDEKRFSLDGNDDWKSYMRNGKCTIRQKRICEGGSVMVWMMILPSGLLSYRFIDGAFNSDKYIEILKTCTVPIIKLNMGDVFYFQEDNSPVHSAKVIQTFFKSSNISVLKWPARSPDLNIIEDVWKLLSDMVYDGPQYQNKQDLKDSIEKFILAINTNLRHKIINLYSSIRSRLCTVLVKKGGLFNKC